MDDYYIEGVMYIVGILQRASWATFIHTGQEQTSARDLWYQIRWWALRNA